MIAFVAFVKDVGKRLSNGVRLSVMCDDHCCVTAEKREETRLITAYENFAVMDCAFLILNNVACCAITVAF